MKTGAKQAFNRFRNSYHYFKNFRRVFSWNARMDKSWTGLIRFFHYKRSKVILRIQFPTQAYDEACAIIHKQPKPSPYTVSTFYDPWSHGVEHLAVEGFQHDDTDFYATSWTNARLTQSIRLCPIICWAIWPSRLLFQNLLHHQRSCAVLLTDQIILQPQTC